MLNFKSVYTPETNQILDIHADRLDKIIPLVAQYFYEELLKEPQATTFLNEDIVKNRLLHSQTAWLRQVLSTHAPEDEQRYVQQQIEIGQVHARIGLPLALMTQGVRIQKRAFFRRLFGRHPSAQEACLNLYLVITDILDYTASLINEAYMRFEQELESESQLFTMIYASSDLAFEILKIKSSLQSWLIDMLTVSDGQACQRQMQQIEETEFWLWIEHRLAQFDNSFRAIRLVLQAQDEVRAYVRNCPCLSSDSRDWRDELKKRIARLTHALQLLSEEVVEENHNRDPLTKLLNRRLLDGVLKKEHHVARVHHADYAIMMIDIDHFKQINDTYGHAVGDAVLKEVAALVRRHLRITDLAFRYGGEEFLVLLPLSHGADPTPIAEKIRHAVEHCDEISQEHDDLRLTVSIGISQYSQHPHPDYIHVLKQADRALYQAKKAGRNRVVRYSGELI